MDRRDWRLVKDNNGDYINDVCPHVILDSDDFVHLCSRNHDGICQDPYSYEECIWYREKRNENDNSEM